VGDGQTGGWQINWRVVFWPRAGLKAAHSLAALRALTVSFSASLVMFGIVMLFIRGPHGSVVAPLAIVIIAAVVVTIVEPRIEKPLECSETALVNSYRARFFVRIASAEMVALLAFMLSFVTGPWWIYYFGAAFALFRFWTQAAPTDAALAADQQELNARGCGIDLIELLTRG
jgi:hypothetical protein